MVTAAGGSEHIAMVVEAHDQGATETMNRVGTSIRTNLITQVRSAVMSMLSLTAIMGAVGISVTGLVVLFRSVVGEIMNTDRAVARIGVTLRTMGFTSEATTRRLNEMRSSLSRITLQALPSLDRSLQESFLTLLPSSQQQIEEAAKKLAELAGIEYETAFEALNEGLLGNMEPLNDLGIEATEYSQALEEVNRKHDILLENETPLSRLWRNIKEGVSDALDAVIRWVNEVGERVDLMAVLKAALILNPVELFKLGRDIWNNILKGLFPEEGDESSRPILPEMGKMGLQMARRLIIGFVDWLLGEDAADIVRLALVGNWGAAWEKLKDDVTGWAERMWNRFLEAYRDFMDTNLGRWIDEHLFQPIGRFITDFLPDVYSKGKDVGMRLVEGMIEGLSSTMQRLVDQAVSWVNRVISIINRGRALLGMSPLDPIQAPQIHQPNRQPPIPGQRVPPSGQGQGARGDIVIPVYIGDRKVDTVVLDSMNRVTRRQLS